MSFSPKEVTAKIERKTRIKSFMMNAYKRDVLVSGTVGQLQELKRLVSRSKST